MELAGPRRGDAIHLGRGEKGKGGKNSPVPGEVRKCSPRLYAWNCTEAQDSLDQSKNGEPNLN